MLKVYYNRIDLPNMIGSFATPDGADWGEADLTEMNEMIQEISGL